MNSVDKYVTIDGSDIQLVVGSQYDESNVSELHAKDYDVVTSVISTLD